MPNLLKEFWDVIKGRKIIVSIDVEDLKPIPLTDLDDYQLINSYQNLSVKSIAYVQEFVERKISKDFAMIPRDFTDELREFSRDLKGFMEKEADKENFNRANLLQAHQETIKCLLIDISKNRKNITKIK